MTNSTTINSSLQRRINEGLASINSALIKAKLFLFDYSSNLSQLENVEINQLVVALQNQDATLKRLQASKTKGLTWEFQIEAAYMQITKELGLLNDLLDSHKHRFSAIPFNVFSCALPD